MQKKLVIAAVAALILLGGVIFVWQKKMTQIQNLPVPEQNKEDMQSIDTSDWKTYKNDQLGIQFSYPKEWKLESKVETNQSVISITSPDILGQNETHKKCCGADISFYSYSSIADVPGNQYHVQAKTLDDYISGDELIQKLGNRKVGNTEMIETIQGGNGAYYTLMKDLNGTIYIVYFSYAGSKKELRDVDEVILSTLKLRE